MNKDTTDLIYLVKRHIKIYFKDKQTFYTSLITPAILIILYATFLKSVYENSLRSIISGGIAVLSDKVVSGFTAGWLISSILGTTSVTLAFCSNTIMVDDKANGMLADFRITPTKPTVISLSYFIANTISTAIVCFLCLGLGLLYIAFCGWFLNAADVIMICLNLILSILFGSLLATVVESFIKNMGAASAVATLVSSMYGFLCGAYMPVSQFSQGIRNFVSFIPGTYGTVLFRKYFLRGAIEEIGKTIPTEYINNIKDGFDSNFYFFGRQVSAAGCFAVLGISVAVLLILFIFITYSINKQVKKSK